MSKKVLILRCGALGDLVYSTFVIDALKEQYGNDCQIDFIIKPEFNDIFKFDTRITNIYTLSQRQWPIFFSSQKKHIIKQSKKEEYDLFINFESHKKFKTLANSIYAKNKIGHFSDNVIYDRQINKTISVVEILKKICSNTINKDILQKNNPKIITNTKDADYKNFIKEHKIKNNYIIIAPSTSHSNKKSRIDYRSWGDNKWHLLAQELAKKYQVLVVGVNKDNQTFKNLANVCDGKNILNLFGKTSISLLVNLVSEAKFLISCDSSIQHMGSCVNTDRFVLLGTTSLKAIAQSTDKSKTYEINAKLPCSPCYKTEVMKQCKEIKCMEKISVQDVLSAIEANTN